MLIDAITKDPNRQRKKLTNIAELAESIKQIGLINPITVTSDGLLIAGERRLEACRSLGWDSIPTTTLHDLDDHQRHVIELEENVKREPLEWREWVQAVGQYRDSTGKSTREVAADLSMSSGNVGRLLLVYDNFELVPAADNHTVAYNIIARKLERQRAAKTVEAQDKIRLAIPTAPVIDAHRPETGQHPPKLPTPTEAPILNTDFMEWAAIYDGPRFNLFHCDFPYGVNAGSNTNQASARYDIEYDDKPETFYELLDAFCEAMPNLREPTAHMVFWFSMKYYTKVKSSLEQVGWHVATHPFIWIRLGNTGIIPDPARGFRQTYETAFFCTYGDRKLIRSGPLAYSDNAGKDWHPSAKPVSMLSSIMSSLVDETTTFLDPTCGAGTVLPIVHNLGGKVLGIERDPEYYERACIVYRAGAR